MIKPFKLLIISLVLISLIFYPLFQAKAMFVRAGIAPWDPEFIKEFFGGTSLNAIAKSITSALIEGLVTTIENKAKASGRESQTGKEVFVKNWRKFILESQYRGEDIWRGILDYLISRGVLCEHIRNSDWIKKLEPRGISLSTLQGYLKTKRLQDIITSLKCDPEVDKKYQVFKRDFKAGGGWDTFARLSQKNNRTEGVLGELLDELELQRELEEKADVNEAVSGESFLSSRKCLVIGPSGGCVIWRDASKPGVLTEKQLVQALEQSFTPLTNIDDFTEFFSIGTLIPLIISTLTALDIL